MKVAVIGGGAMGAGIAQVLLAAGDSVFLFEVSDAAWKKASEHIEKGLKKKSQEARLADFKRLDSLEDAAHCDWAVEAVPEKLELKHSLFIKLDRILSAPKILATNTSSLSISSIAGVCAHPERVVGLHFFNPVPIMRFMEIIPGQKTSAQALSFAVETARRLGKEAVVVKKDSPGFVANRILMPFGLEALEVLETRRVHPSKIDEVVRRMGQFRMGPFELMDFIGLDVCMEINRIIYEGLGKPERFLSHGSLETLAARGHLGRKTGRGFYQYGPDGKIAGENPDLGLNGNPAVPDEEIFLLILSAVIHESFLIVEEGVANAEEVDKTFLLGANWKKGPFGFFKELGPARVLAVLEREAKRHPKRYEPIPATLRHQVDLSKTRV